jgi:geranylgeranyl diphosphate synthase type II
LGKEDEAVILVGCVAEMVHAASLILDDLPCMDDADMRRNQPSTHIAFDESTAILSATALLNQAFSVISKLNNVSDSAKVMLVDLLSHTVGSNGLIAGQMADLSNNSSATTLKDVEDLNTLKTGALFDFSIESAAILANASEAKKKHLKEFSRYLGLAFQLMDDVKDKLMTQELAEKSINKDIGKATILAIKGSRASMEILNNYLKKSKESLRMANLSNLNTFDVLFESQFSFLKILPKN